MQVEYDLQADSGIIEQPSGDKDENSLTDRAAQAHFAVVARIIERAQGGFIKDRVGGRQEDRIQHDDGQQGSKRSRVRKDEQGGDHPQNAGAQDQFTAAEDIRKESEQDAAGKRYQTADAAELPDLPAAEIDAFIVQPNERDKRRQTGPIEKKRSP